MGRTVSLNIGGHLFETTEETLTGNGSNSFFSGLLSHPSTRDDKGRYFIDRDGQYFAPILSYLRTGILDIPQNMSEACVRREAGFYCVQLPTPPAPFKGVRCDGIYVSFEPGTSEPVALIHFCRDGSAKFCACRADGVWETVECSYMCMGDTLVGMRRLDTAPLGNEDSWEGEDRGWQGTVLLSAVLLQDSQQLVVLSSSHKSMQAEVHGGHWGDPTGQSPARRASVPDTAGDGAAAAPVAPTGARRQSFEFMGTQLPKPGSIFNSTPVSLTTDRTSGAVVLAFGDDFRVRVMTTSAHPGWSRATCSQYEVRWGALLTSRTQDTANTGGANRPGPPSPQGDGESDVPTSQPVVQPSQEDMANDALCHLDILENPNFPRSVDFVSCVDMVIEFVQLHDAHTPQLIFYRPLLS